MIPHHCNLEICFIVYEFIIYECVWLRIPLNLQPNIDLSPTYVCYCEKQSFVDSKDILPFNSRPTLPNEQLMK